MRATLAAVCVMSTSSFLLAQASASKSLAAEFSLERLYIDAKLGDIRDLTEVSTPDGPAIAMTGTRGAALLQGGDGIRRRVAFDESLRLGAVRAVCDRERRLVGYVTGENRGVWHVCFLDTEGRVAWTADTRRLSRDRAAYIELVEVRIIDGEVRLVVFMNNATCALILTRDGELDRRLEIGQYNVDDALCVLDVPLADRRRLLCGIGKRGAFEFFDLNGDLAGRYEMPGAAFANRLTTFVDCADHGAIRFRVGAARRNGSQISEVLKLQPHSGMSEASIEARPLTHGEGFTTGVPITLGTRTRFVSGSIRQAQVAPVGLGPASGSLLVTDCDGGWSLLPISEGDRNVQPGECNPLLGHPSVVAQKPNRVIAAWGTSVYALELRCRCVMDGAPRSQGP